MFLLDTNVFLEYLLDQAQAVAVEQMLGRIEPTQLRASDFSLHSIGIILLRRGDVDLFARVLNEFFGENGIDLVTLGIADLAELVRVSTQFRLDFDDAYQYVVARKYGLDLVSFDSDFDRTDIRRRLPAEVSAGG